MNNSIISRTSRVLFLLFAALFMGANGLFAQSVNTYEYDNLNRLIKTTYANGVIVQYTYDAVGNRISKTVTGTVGSFIITASANPAEGGTVNGGGTYQQGENCTLTAMPNSGYGFVRWTKNGSQVSTNTSYTFTVTENASYVAVFEQSQSTVTHSQPLASGWNWWSTYVELVGIDGLSQLENSLGASGVMIKSRADGYVEYFQYNGTSDWFGSLQSIGNEQMYKINVNANCSATITGSLATSSSHPITIGNGWNWIGFPLSQPVGVAEALSGFTPAVNDILKGRNGYTTYFSYNGTEGWFGSLNTLEPGSGYMYQSQGSGTKTLVFQSGRGEATMANVTPENNRYRPLGQRFADNMTVTAVVELGEEELQGENYELAAFVNGECRGSAKLIYVEPLNRYMAFLTIAGDETADLNFDLYDTETGTVETQCITSLQYETNAVVGSLETPYVIRFRSMTGLDDWVSSLQIFPNPVARGEWISLGSIDEIGVAQIEIINALGVVVETWRAVSLQTMTAPMVSGVYTLRITGEGKGTCYRKLVVR